MIFCGDNGSTQSRTHHFEPVEIACNAKFKSRDTEWSFEIPEDMAWQVRCIISSDWWPWGKDSLISCLS